MATPQDIIDAALAKNRKNQPGKIATNEELFSTFLRIYPVFWTIGARVNRTFFGASETIAGAAGAWPRPTEAEMIFRIESGGSRVHVVDLDNRDAEPGEPCVYEWGQSFQPAGNPNDPSPSSDSLDFFYSKEPTLPATAATELEALWPDSYDELLVLEMALVLSIKDEREHEIPVLSRDRDVWLSRFIAHLEHATTGVVSSRDLNRFQAQSSVPLDSLLAGGTSVEL